MMSLNRFAIASSIIVFLSLSAACTSTKPAMTPPTPLDLKITNGRILDGSGSPWFRGDVGISGDRIVAIGNLTDRPATTTIDARERIVSPGFIDLLSWAQYGAIDDPQMEAHVRQGITTAIAGEGYSPGPRLPEQLNATERWTRLGDYLDQLDRQGAAFDLALLVGASNPRQMVIGDVDRAPTAEEMRQMEAIVEQAMRDGAIGISTSLIYVPAMYSTSEELVALARVAARHGGMYFSHIRDEGDRIYPALEEAFHIGREAGIPVNIWHLKIGGRPNWGTMPKIVETIAAQRRAGLDVAANVYPYAASSTSLSTLAPDWAMEGGYDDFQRRLANPADRARIAETFRAQVARRGEKGIYVAQVFNDEQKHLEKKFIEEIAATMGVTPDEALIRLFETNRISPRVIYFGMSEEDVQHALKQPWISVGSDASAPGAAIRSANTAIHPRAYGTFPRVIGHYARDLGLFSVEEAVRKITSQAALRAHLFDRGLLRPGMKADIVIFDDATIKDRSTFDDPHHFSTGITDVVVSGVAVLRDGTMTGALPGRSVRGRGHEK